MEYHSYLEVFSSSSGNRCARRDLTALASAFPVSLSLRQRERMSPTAGPPSTRTISAVLPPSSETGKTCETLVVYDEKYSATPLNAVPPEKTTKLGFSLACNTGVPSSKSCWLWKVDASKRSHPLQLIRALRRSPSSPEVLSKDLDPLLAEC